MSHTEHTKRTKHTVTHEAHYSVAADEKLDRAAVMNLFRNFYEGTEFDLTGVSTLSPVHCPLVDTATCTLPPVHCPLADTAPATCTLPLG
jgi:hypothetical protein